MKRMIRLIAGCSFVLLGSAASFSASESSKPSPEKAGTAGKLFGDAERGQALITALCLGCHVVDGPVINDQVPSLKAIANNPAKDSKYLHGFLMRPHKPMPPLQLSNQEIEDVIAFVQGLRG